MRGTAGTDSDYDLLVVVPDDVPPCPAAKHPGLRDPLGPLHVWRHPRVDPHRLLRATSPPCVPAVHGRAGGESSISA